MKPFFRTLLLVTAIGGCLLALWPAGQMLYARRSQDALHRRHAAQQQAAQLRMAQQRRAAKQKARRAATELAALRTANKREFPSTRLVCPEAELDAVVVRGVEDDDLRRGPGWMPGSALPGETGNCVIAGHRNIYGSPFGRLDALFPGSEIRVETPDSNFRYLVIAVFTAADNDPTVTAPPADGSAQLTLITCTTPKTAYRLIVTAVKTG